MRFDKVNAKIVQLFCLTVYLTNHNISKKSAKSLVKLLDFFFKSKTKTKCLSLQLYTVSSNENKVFCK